ncbi:MAG TPA: GNAT family N-acetyltransferase [Acidimicrobiales bacterium]|nr:GNAT family N-acetyltransferase [Acidimicrobiales bacterium]
MPRDDIDSGHRNLITYTGALASWGSKGSVREEHGVLLCASGTWLAVVENTAFRLTAGVTATDLVDRAEGFFGEIGRGYCMKLRSTGDDEDLRAVCAERGLVEFGEPIPHMICDHRLGDPAPPDGVELRAVTDIQGVIDFVTINAEAYATYGMPADVLPDLFDLPELVVADERTFVVVAYMADRPVATALTFVSDGVGGIQWVGTVPDVRNMGLGRTVTEWATNLAFAKGASSCTLQASPMGEPIYAALGYETVYHYRECVRWQPPNAPDA